MQGLLLRLSLLASALALQPAQQVLQLPNAASPITIEQDESFMTFKHEEFPTHEVRAIQPLGFCDSTVQQWSGYLDTPNDRHLYFW
jgi:cathepsin A (carboxypeptidase C)